MLLSLCFTGGVNKCRKQRSDRYRQCGTNTDRKFSRRAQGESATALGAVTIKEAVHRAKLSPDQIDEVLMGCVLPAGLGQAPGRQAAIHAGLPQTVPCSTINKVCGSGMKTVMLGADLISAGSADIVVAGGMESMTNAPYLLEKARGGYRMGHGKIYDHMFLDGLEDAYDKGRAMGTFAEETADQYQFTRQQQDEFALRSLSRSLKATEAGSFAKELVNVAELDRDEQPTRAKPEKYQTSSLLSAKAAQLQPPIPHRFQMVRHPSP